MGFEPIFSKVKPATFYPLNYSPIKVVGVPVREKAAYFFSHFYLTYIL